MKKVPFKITKQYQCFLCKNTAAAQNFLGETIHNLYLLSQAYKEFVHFKIGWTIKGFLVQVTLGKQ